MTHFILRHLLTVNQNIHKDPVMLTCMQKLFEWANEAGLKGQKVYGLIMPDPNPNDPLDSVYRIWCKMECTEEQKEVETMRSRLKSAPRMTRPSHRG